MRGFGHSVLLQAASVVLDVVICSLNACYRLTQCYRMLLHAISVLLDAAVCCFGALACYLSDSGYCRMLASEWPHSRHRLGCLNAVMCCLSALIGYLNVIGVLSYAVSVLL